MSEKGTVSRPLKSAQLLLGFSVYNLIRLGSLSGWCEARMYRASYAQKTPIGRWLGFCLGFGFAQFVQRL